MKRLLTLVLLAASLASAGGLDFGLSARNGTPNAYMGSLSVRMDLSSWALRAGFVAGAPNAEVLLEGDLLYTLAFPLISPYLVGGVALGLAGSTRSGAFNLVLGRPAYTVLGAGLAFPSRGYRPYLEVDKYTGPTSFARLTVGFVVEMF